MRVIVIFPGALGDFCLLVPVLAALRADGTAVAVSIRRALEPVAALLLPALELGPPADGAAMATLFGGDVAGDVHAWLRGSDRVHAWLGRGDVEVAARLAAASLVPPQLHAVPRGDAGPHATDEYAAALGVRPAADGWWSGDAPAGSAQGVTWRAPHAARLLLHPGAGARAKRWSKDGFRAVADAWVGAGGEAVVVLGPAEEADAAWWRSGAHPVASDLGLTEAAAAIASAPCWVGNDSGMTQLAGLLRRRGVALFGPTRPERWRPRLGPLQVVTFAARPVPDVVRDVRRVLGAPRRGDQLDTPTPRH